MQTIEDTRLSKRSNSTTTANRLALGVKATVRWRRFEWSYHPFVIWCRALFRWWRYRVLRRRYPIHALNRLMAAHREQLKLQTRGGTSSRFRARVETSIRREFANAGPAHDYLDFEARPLGGRERAHLLNYGSIVLKTPRVQGNRVLEKGVLMLKGHRAFKLLCSSVDVGAVLGHYRLVLETSWCGFARIEILHFTRFAGQGVVVSAPEASDFEGLHGLGSNLIPVHIGCSDWPNPAIFRPLRDEAKRFDAVMVARYAIAKRHHIMLRALRELDDPAIRVAFVGLPPHEERLELEWLIDAYRVRGNVELVERVRQPELNRILNQSKVNVLLSLQEGGNRCLFEGLFADIPALALRNNVGLPKGHFTAQTGKLIDERELAKELLFFREHWSSFDPRAWAQTHIRPEITTANLNEILMRLARQDGEAWTRDIVAKYNATGLKYYPNSEAGRDLPKVEEILIQFAR